MIIIGSKKNIKLLNKNVNKYIYKIKEGKYFYYYKFIIECK